MSRANEIRDMIARSAAWWSDHAHAVRAESALNERDHFERMLTDFAYRGRELLGEQMNRAAIRRQGLNRPPVPSRHVEPSGPGEMTDLGDRMARVPDNDGLGFHDYLPPYESKKNAWMQENAEKDFAEHCENETGMELSAKEYAKLKKKSRATMRQSKAIAEKLHAAGEALIAEIRDIVTTSGAPVSEYELTKQAEEIRRDFDAYRHDEYNLFVYWLHSKTIESLPKYRRSCLLPYIAAMTRAPKLAALEYFIQERSYCKFWTFTTGNRCIAEEIPGRLDWMFNRLRGLNKELNRRWGVQIVFRTTEFGTLEADDDDKRILPLNTRTEQMEFDERNLVNAPGRIERNSEGRALYHPHAHCVVWSSRGFIGDDWANVIKFVHAYWKRDGKAVRWLADGIIRDARECCKYVTKPGDIINLSDLDLAAFANATRGRRMVRPLGILADEIRDRKENGRILRRKRVGSSTRWVVVLNQNRLTSETDEEKAARENLEDAYEFTDECELQGNALPPSLPGKLDGGAVVPRVRDIDISRVMARIGPAAGPTPLKEPRVIIMTSRLIPDMTAIVNHPLVVSLWANTVEQWEAGRALTARYNVHTGTLSGEDSQEVFSEFDPPPDFEAARPHKTPGLPAFSDV